MNAHEQILLLSHASVAIGSRPFYNVQILQSRFHTLSQAIRHDPYQLLRANLTGQITSFRFYHSDQVSIVCSVYLAKTKGSYTASDNAYVQSAFQSSLNPTMPSPRCMCTGGTIMYRIKHI